MSGATLAATFIGVGTSSGSQTQCADVLIDSDTGTAGDMVTLSTTTAGAHIFYTSTLDNPINPTHNGDNPTGSTIRIANNSGVVTAPGNLAHSGFIRALAYKMGLLDSSISQGSYDAIGPSDSGGGGNP
jgi:hypothetical protein